MTILCQIMGHHRSRRFASFNVEDDRWESFCTRCQARLARDHGGTWQTLIKFKRQRAEQKTSVPVPAALSPVNARERTSSSVEADQQVPEVA